MEGDNPILLINASLHKTDDVNGRLKATHPKMSHAQELHKTKELHRQNLVRLLTIHPIDSGDSFPLKEHFEKNFKWNRLTYFFSLDIRHFLITWEAETSSKYTDGKIKM